MLHACVPSDRDHGSGVAQRVPRVGPRTAYRVLLRTCCHLKSLRPHVRSCRGGLQKVYGGSSGRCDLGLRAAWSIKILWTERTVHEEGVGNRGCRPRRATHRVEPRLKRQSSSHDDPDPRKSGCEHKLYIHGVRIWTHAPCSVRAKPRSKLKTHHDDRQKSGCVHFLYIHDVHIRTFLARVGRRATLQISPGRACSARA
jgi:hypothetical protein